MKTNAKMLNLGPACAWMLLTSSLFAQTTTQVFTPVGLSQSAVGQVSNRAARREADDLLRQARAALKEGNLPKVRWCLDRIDEMNVKYEGLIHRFSDTPAKVRRDLQKLEKANQNTIPVAPRNAPNHDSVEPNPLPINVAGSRPVQPPSVGQAVNNPYTASAQANNAVLPPSYPRPQLSPYPASDPSSANSVTAWTPKKKQTLQLLASARVALNRGDITAAEQLARQAHALQVPDGEFAAGEPRPWMLLMEIGRAKRQVAGAVSTVGAVPVPPGGQAANVNQRAIYRASEDITQVRPANAPGALVQQAVAPEPGDDLFTLPPSPPQPAQSGVSTGDTVSSTNDRPSALRWMEQGEAAVKKRDFASARDLFRQAWQQESELDPAARQRLQDHLQLLDTSDNSREVAAERMTAGELALVRRFTDEVAREQLGIRRTLQDDPRGAWRKLKDLRDRVADADIPNDARQSLLSRVNRAMTEAENYIERNRGKIELDRRNEEVLNEIDRRRQNRIEIDDQLAGMVDTFNQLMHQQRHEEAIVLARKAQELSPNNPAVESMMWKSNFAERFMVEMSLRDRSQHGVNDSLTSVLESGVPFDDRVIIEFPERGNAKFWSDMSARRIKAMNEGGRRWTETELKIQRALRETVQVDYTDQPLAEVLQDLGSLAGISIYIDPQGLAVEGVTSDTPVTLNLNQDLQLKSALNIILEQFGLSYVVQDEVLKVTSASVRDSKVYTSTYDVADLVIPIPNFQPGYNMGLPSAIREAYQAQAPGVGAGGYNQVPLTVLANNQQTTDASTDQSVLAQMASSGALPTGTRTPQPLGMGPGGLGGGAQADFDTLIDLIVATIAPNSWDDVGGEGSIQGFPTNLSLVVSQTQDVHEQIADLLRQLRRLQDLQVTIEVRFITLNDNFFERIGVDFDFDIDDNTGFTDTDGDGLLDIPPEIEDTKPHFTIGLDPQGNPTADLDLSFTQDSFGATVPAFGGFDAGTAANFGFAILSDIEAFFIIQAAQGDNRSNVLQAPKVTLFNGQQANVNDSSQRPFVTSVTPVVGDFAAAQAPIIVVLSEGTSLNVQAVVSPDRRFVRLTLVPFFSKIGDVEEFTFEGTRTSRTGTAAADPTDETQTVSNNAEEIISGTTVQLPQFAFTSVSTTVSVPDGGTILLGGIKRLQEGRNERGVPLLSKFPYINRLFKNVGIGRTTQSLMMMVTPRIIIQEEEENKLGIALPGS